MEYSHDEAAPSTVRDAEMARFRPRDEEE